MHRRGPWIVFGAWFVALNVLSSIPGSRFGPMPFSFADKAVHIALFLAGSFPLTLGLLDRLKWNRASVAGLAMLFMMVIAVLDEFHQLFTPGRSGMDPGDMTADVLGAAIGIGCACLFHARRRSKPNHEAARGNRAA